MSSKHLILLLVAVLVGGVVPVQANVNAQLGRLLGTEVPQKIATTCVSFIGGTLGAIVLLLIVSGGRPRLETSPLNAPPLLLTGGLYGVVFVSASIMLVPRIGTAATVGAMLCGQMIVSVFFDHIGFLGAARYAATPGRIGGLALMMLGLLLVSQKKAEVAAVPETVIEAGEPGVPLTNTPTSEG